MGQADIPDKSDIVNPLQTERLVKFFGTTEREPEDLLMPEGVPEETHKIALCNKNSIKKTAK